MRRPLGVSVLAIISCFYGLIGLLKALAWLGLGGAFATWLGITFPVAGIVTLGVAFAFGVSALIVALFNLGFAWGAWRLRPWAWRLGIATQALSFFWTLIVTALGPGTLRTNLWALVIPAAIWLYLKTPDVRRAFAVA